MELGISATTMEFDEFCRFQKKYKNQIMKIQRKMDYFLFREQNFIKEDRFLEDLFLESILVDVRALLMENARYKNNYTLQNTFKINSSNEEDIRFKVASGIDDLLKEMLLPDGQTSFFEAVKFYTDKYIAHRDNTTIGDDEKKEKIKEYFLNNKEFGLVFTVKAIIEYAKDTEREIKLAVLGELTKMPENSELENEDIRESVHSLDRDIEKKRDIDSKLINEILRKSPRDIAYLINFDVRGLKINDANSIETKEAVSKFVAGIEDEDVMEFIIKVKETPNIR